MNSAINPTKKLLARAVGAAVVSALAVIGFGSAIATAQTSAPMLPPDPCLVDTCHNGIGHDGVPQLNPQPLPPGFRDRIWLLQRDPSLGG